MGVHICAHNHLIMPDFQNTVFPTLSGNESSRMAAYSIWFCYAQNISALKGKNVGLPNCREHQDLPSKTRTTNEVPDL